MMTSYFFFRIFPNGHLYNTYYLNPMGEDSSRQHHDAHPQQASIQDPRFFQNKKKSAASSLNHKKKERRIPPSTPSTIGLNHQYTSLSHYSSGSSPYFWPTCCNANAPFATKGLIPNYSKPKPRPTTTNHPPFCN
jgi:hypothetical protein